MVLNKVMEYVINYHIHTLKSLQNVGGGILAWQKDVLLRFYFYNKRSTMALIEHGEFLMHTYSVSNLFLP